MTFLHSAQLMTRFFFRLIGEILNHIKTVAKPPHNLLLDSNHEEILFQFQYKFKPLNRYKKWRLTEVQSMGIRTSWRHLKLAGR